MQIIQHEASQLPHEISVSDGDEIKFGNSSLRVLHTPGHSKDSICLIGDGKIFSGDTLFAGVYFASSGVAPAMVIPGIVHVSVCEMVNANRNFFPLTDSINILHALSSPHVCSPSICLLSHQGYKIRLWNFTHYWICTLLITDCRGFHRAIIVPRIHDQLDIYYHI